MRIIEQISLALHSLLATLRSLFVPPMWVPWLVLAAAQSALVASIGWFAHPAVSWYAMPLVRLLGGEDALHYPRIFRLLPALYARADLAVGALIGAVLVGAATRLFAARYSGLETRPGAELFWALRRAPALIVVNLPLNLMLVLLSFGLDTVLGRPDLAGPVRQGLAIGGLVAAMLLQAMFLFATPLVAVSELSPGAALAALPGAFRRAAFSALSLALLAVLALLPLQALAGLGDTLVERGTPELVAGMTLVQMVLGLLTGFLLTGSATLVYQTSLARGVEHRRRVA